MFKIHHAIVEAEVEAMMGKEMIVYKAKGMMKYALASVKKYMSLHVLPIYGHQPLHLKYKALLPNASFQKGCTITAPIIYGFQVFFFNTSPNFNNISVCYATPILNIL